MVRENATHKAESSNSLPFWLRFNNSWQSMFDSQVQNFRLLTAKYTFSSHSSRFSFLFAKFHHQNPVFTAIITAGILFMLQQIKMSVPKRKLSEVKSWHHIIRHFWWENLSGVQNPYVKHSSSSVHLLLPSPPFSCQPPVACNFPHEIYWTSSQS